MGPVTVVEEIASACLEDKIVNHTARVGIVGLGYVGLPLAVEFAKAGFSVTGIDVQDAKVAKINAAKSYIQDVPDWELKSLVESGRLTATSEGTHPRK
jgi:UDP-N-acetyl-D-glucosamine dehydrogenase